MQTSTTLGHAPGPFDLTDRQRVRALVALVVALVVLLGAGILLDRVTTQRTVLPGAFVPPAVPFPREVADGFANRAAGGLGLAPTGQRWVTGLSRWSAADGTARVIAPAPAGSSNAVIRVGRGPGSVSLTAATVVKGMGLAFRCKSESECWTLTAVPDYGTWQLTQITPGGAFDQQNVGTVPVADGTRVRVDNAAGGFDVFVNDALARHVDNKEYSDAPGAGMVVPAGADALAARFADFRARQSNIVGPGAPVRDAFDRSDADGLGTGPTGQRWSVATGSWAIRDGEAVLRSTPTLKPSIATIDTGRTEGWVQVTATTAPTGTGLVFRYRDPSNYWRVTAVPSFATFNIIKVVKGVETRVGGTGLTSFGDTTTIGIRLKGRKLTVYVDGVETVTVSSPDLRGAHRAGLVLDSPKALGARFAGIAAAPLDAAGPGSAPASTPGTSP